MVAVYDVPLALGLQWKLTQSAKRIPFVTMPNIILQRAAVRELLGPQCRAENIVPEVEKLLENPAARTEMSEDYRAIRHALGEELPLGATARTARILDELV